MKNNKNIINMLNQEQIKLVLKAVEEEFKEGKELNLLCTYILDYLKETNPPFKDKIESIESTNLTLFPIPKIEKKSNIPSFDEFKKYALSKEGSVKIDLWKLQLKYEAWVENGWKDGKSKVIKSWKAKLLQTIPFLLERESNRKKAATYIRSKAIESITKRYS